MFALIDCNNFYASCERLFRPDLTDKPIVILSSNDGCVIARSNEAKALGIPMGVPFFQVRALCKQYNVHIFSSNFTLYGDLSRRVMAIIEAAWPETAIYSIDEAFLDLSTMPASQHDEFCRQLQKKLLKYTGIPVSVGLGPTKTLAKLANHVAKRELKTPVFNITEQREWLNRVAIGDVWGIGRHWGKKLLHQGYYTAGDLAAADLYLIRKQYNVLMQRTVMELNGISCSGLGESEPRQSIISSKTFGSMQTEYTAIEQIVSSHCVRAHEKLRQQESLAGYLSVFIRTNRFRADLPQYYQSTGCKLITPSDDLRYLVHSAKLCLKKLFRSGFHYYKAGIQLDFLTDKRNRQFDLFHQASMEEMNKTERLMCLLDSVNKKYGRHALHLAAEGFSHPWGARAELRSPCYTTKWSDLRRVRLG
ncbi:Y-family DNA polymerase [Legionella dresdenensis]|uniref:Y-family DNA polymerase n=1 Tax=Legionella dresdenensis TaxID=450200 RepID=A0ABV8CGW2_9GAMM